MTNEVFENAIKSYKKKYSLTDEDISSNENSKVDNLILSLCDFSKTSNPALYQEFVALLMNNLIRFVGDDFTPLQPEYSINSTSFKASSQEIMVHLQQIQRFLQMRQHLLNLQADIQVRKSMN